MPGKEGKAPWGVALKVSGSEPLKEIGQSCYLGFQVCQIRVNYAGHSVSSNAGVTLSAWVT
jgi:hypothetical protein